MVESRKALFNAASSKSPFPDGLPAGLSQKPQSLGPYLLELHNAIYATGYALADIRAIHIVPPPKPHKGPSDSANHRPTPC